MMGPVSIARKYEIIPGIVIRRMPKEKSLNYKQSRSTDHNPHFDANYMVEVFKDRYLSGLTKRVEPRHHKHITTENLEFELSSLLMQVGISICLATRNSFCYFHSIKKTTNDGVSHVFRTGCPNRLPIIAINHALSPATLKTKTFDAHLRKQTTNIALKIDRFYRSGIYNYSSTSLALAHFTFALFSN